MRLHEAAVDRYGPIANWHPDLTEGLTVFSGPNEAGKTLYLEALIQLLDPAVSDVLEPPPRYDEEPVGRVVLEHGDTRYDLGSETPLSSVTNIQPIDIPTVFVVRDRDLAMPEGTSYYTDLVEHLGEVHTSAIEAVVDELRALGRLTDKNLNLSSRFDDAKATRADAVGLRDEIGDYLEEIADSGMDQLQRERTALTREHERVREEHAKQEAAKKVATHARLDRVLEELIETNGQLDELEMFTDDALADLRETERHLERTRDEIDSLEDDIEGISDDLEAATETHERTKTELQRLRGREAAVEQAETALEEYRSQESAAASASRQQTLGRRGAIAGAVATGLATAGGALAGSTVAYGLAGALLVLTILAASIAYRANRAASGVDRAATRAVATAQDAGLDVEAVDEIGPAIESFRSRLTETADRSIRAEERENALREDHSRIEQELKEHTDTVDDLSETLQAELETAGVEDVDAFARRVETRSEAAEAHRIAAQRLEDALGPVEAEGWTEQVETWRRRLDELVRDVDTAAVSASEFDEDRLDELTDELQRLTAERDRLEEDLDAYDTRLDRFDERAAEIAAEPFIDRRLALEGRSPAALRTLVDELDELIEAIDADADAARRAIKLLRSIKDDQQRKITDLFDPEGPTSRAFSRITYGRYDGVSYDPDAGTLIATSDGEAIDVDALSAGATDQLYLASRLSLADRLLDGGTGFLLLDDPLVTADRDRLHNGFETLQSLVDDGWQLVYLTAKAEVYEGMVDRFDLAHERVEPIG